MLVQWGKADVRSKARVSKGYSVKLRRHSCQYIGLVCVIGDLQKCFTKYAYQGSMYEYSWRGVLLKWSQGVKFPRHSVNGTYIFNVNELKSVYIG